MKELKKKEEEQLMKAMNDNRRKCLYGGALAESIGQRCRYVPAQQPVYCELMSSVKNYIIYRNLEIYPEDWYPKLKEYSSVDDPIYRYCMEDVKHLPGSFIHSFIAMTSHYLILLPNTTTTTTWTTTTT